MYNLEDDPPVKPLTLGQLLDQQEQKFGSREAIVEFMSGSRLTYRELNVRVKQIARALVAKGIQRGDRVAVFLSNCAAYAEVFLAISRLGAIAVLIQGPYTAEETRNVLRMSECSALLLGGQFGTTGSNAFLAYLNDTDPTEIAAELPSLKSMVLVKDDERACNKCVTTWSSFLESADTVTLAQLDQLEKDHIVPDTVCSFLLTSGTTGLPKMAMLTHRNLMTSGFVSGHHISVDHTDRLCNCFPLFHIAGLVFGPMDCISHGACMVLPAPRFDAARTLDCLAAEDCTGMLGAPTMFAGLLHAFERTRPPMTIQLKKGMIGAAPAPAELWTGLRKAFGLEGLANTYGSFMSSPMGLSECLGVVPHMSAKVVDSRGGVVPLGERGELCVAGDLVCKGYFQNEQKTNEAMVHDADGLCWMHTGDQAFFDEDDNCHLTGRIKDIIIQGGENIYPREIEDRLCQHPAVLRACVVGLADDYLGQVVAAFLDHQPETERPSDRELAAWVRASLSPHNAPAWIFWLQDPGVPAELPMLESGKVRKHVLQEIGQEIVRGREVLLA
ncbi:putative long-chain-fatty-acid-CoA ligase [Aspergillus violaceofuscus CBS 115571]|uniref:Putative long-chain-fatty-acid-CoA ligase n=1 Tax=Aspergillus violaceofuscus (strain CBS 115571) TaxID=1450538 RepID=A0A2V5HRD4_ASPV1|nr:putative long-chain-fatty-acid-CoA ligase [Aspergillus violaceofuscus CBS 115571]